MHKATDFIAWAVARAKPESIPTGAVIPFPVGVAETGAWEYLFGTTGVEVTQALLDYKYETYYSKKGWTLKAYTEATDGWVLHHVIVCDCEGLLDAFLGKDVNADYCYQSWCTDKGKINNINRQWVLGEAVFKESRRANGSWYKSHIGWVCGFMPDGEPVIVEERGIRYGCVITKLTDRPWTYRGLVTKKLDYTEDITSMNSFDPIVTSPYSRGPEYLAVQQMLHSLGYLKSEPNSIWGPVSQAAWEDFISKYTPKTGELDIFFDGELLKKFEVLKDYKD